MAMVVAQGMGIGAGLDDLRYPGHVSGPPVTACKQNLVFIWGVVASPPTTKFQAECDAVAFVGGMP